jgi:hypothetical protein
MELRKLLSAPQNVSLLYELRITVLPSGRMNLQHFGAGNMLLCVFLCSYIQDVRCSHSLSLTFIAFHLCLAPVLCLHFLHSPVSLNLCVRAHVNI